MIPGAAPGRGYGPWNAQACRRRFPRRTGFRWLSERKISELEKYASGAKSAAWLTFFTRGYVEPGRSTVAPVWQRVACHARRSISAFHHCLARIHRALGVPESATQSKDKVDDDPAQMSGRGHRVSGSNEGVVDADASTALDGVLGRSRAVLSVGAWEGQSLPPSRGIRLARHAQNRALWERQLVALARWQNGNEGAQEVKSPKFEFPSRGWGNGATAGARKCFRSRTKGQGMSRHSKRLSVFLGGLMILGLIFWPIMVWMSGLGQGARWVIGIPMLIVLFGYMFMGGIRANQGSRRS